MSYKPAIAFPSYRPRDAGDEAPFQHCIVCAVNEDQSVNLLVFDAQCQANAVMGAVIIQADEDGCPPYYTDPAPATPESPADRSARGGNDAE